MRLSPFEAEAIRNIVTRIFGKGSKVYLFGSRVDDSKRGGDIDLYISPANKERLASGKIDFLVALKKEIGDQRIDVIIDRGQNRLIDQIARDEGILLCAS